MIIIWGMIPEKVRNIDFYRTKKEFESCEGAYPFIPIFQDYTLPGTIKAKRIGSRNFLMGQGSTDASSTILVLRSSPLVLTSSVAKPDGLTLYLLRGNVDDLLDHHQDILTNPPLYGFRNGEYMRYGINARCSNNCRTHLLATIHTDLHFIKNGEQKRSLEANFFATDVILGSEGANWMFKVLQEVNEKSSVVSSGK